MFFRAPKIFSKKFGRNLDFFLFLWKKISPRSSVTFAQSERMRGRISFPFCFSAFFVDFCFYWKLILKHFEIQPISCRWHCKKVFSKRIEPNHTAQLCFRRNVDFLTFSRILRMFQDCFFKSAVQVWVKSTSAFDFCAVQTSLVQLHNFIFILKHFWTSFCFAFCLILPVRILIRPSCCFL